MGFRTMPLVRGSWGFLSLVEDLRWRWHVAEVDRSRRVQARDNMTIVSFAGVVAKNACKRIQPC